MVNALDACEGIITRKREVENKTEEAVLDFVIINEKIQPFLRKMKIDEDREITLINLAQIKKNKRLIETDHNAIVIEMDFEMAKIKPQREELFNLKNKASQEAFFLLKQKIM